MATLSAAGGAIPIPGVGGVLDIVLIRCTVKAYCKQLGLNNSTTEEIALLDTKYKEIIQRYESIISAKELASSVVTKASGIMIGVEEISKYIPIFGIVIASSAAFALTLRYLLSAVAELEEAAIAVWDNAANLSIRTLSEPN